MLGLNTEKNCSPIKMCDSSRNVTFATQRKLTRVTFTSQISCRMQENSCYNFAQLGISDSAHHVTMAVRTGNRCCMHHFSVSERQAVCEFWCWLGTSAGAVGIFRNSDGMCEDLQLKLVKSVFAHGFGVEVYEDLVAYAECMQVLALCSSGVER